MVLWLYYGIKYGFSRVAVTCSLILGGVRLRRLSINTFYSFFYISKDMYFTVLMLYNSVLTFGAKTFLFLAERVVCECWLFDFSK